MCSAASFGNTVIPGSEEMIEAVVACSDQLTVCVWKKRRFQDFGAQRR